jgi:hypothetical protein
MMIKVSGRMAGNSRKRICNGGEVPPNTAFSRSAQLPKLGIGFDGGRAGRRHFVADTA